MLHDNAHNYEGDKDCKQCHSYTNEYKCNAVRTLFLNDSCRLSCIAWDSNVFGLFNHLCLSDDLSFSIAQPVLCEHLRNDCLNRTDLLVVQALIEVAIAEPVFTIIAKEFVTQHTNGSLHILPSLFVWPQPAIDILRLS